MRVQLWFAGLCVLLGTLSSSPLVHAGSRKGDGMPVVHGQRSVTTQVGLKGAHLVLQKRFGVLVPAGLPIGRSSITLKLAKKRARGRQIAPGFAPIGPTAIFDRAIHAESKPLRVEFKPGKVKLRPRRRFVLAVEKQVFCEDAPKGAARLGHGLCSGWELLRARRLPRRLRAKLAMPTGMRLQFGTVPRGK